MYQRARGTFARSSSSSTSHARADARLALTPTMHTRGKLFQHLARAQCAFTAASGAQSAAGTAPWRAIASSARSVTTPMHGTTAAAAAVGGFRGA
jgi:hypothetical protein